VGETVQPNTIGRLFGIFKKFPRDPVSILIRTHGLVKTIVCGAVGGMLAEFLPFIIIWTMSGYTPVTGHGRFCAGLQSVPIDHVVTSIVIAQGHFVRGLRGGGVL
jgi:hypothetical protein